MLFYLFLLLAALSAAMCSFFIRKNLDKQGSSHAHLVVLFFISLLVAIQINPVFQTETTWSFPMWSTGCFVGCLNLGLMLLISRALKLGPPGLTFAFLNSGSILPTFFLYLIFGISYGFQITFGLLLGMLLILIGLFLSTNHKGENYSKSWLIYAISIFLLQGLTLSVLHWRCLLMDSFPEHMLLPFKCDPQEDMWVMPGMFATATLVQSLIFVINEKRWFRFNEVLFGGLSGLCNGLSTYFLLMATNIASSVEKGILFPSFAVLVIILCHLWGKVFYQENVNWFALSLCVGGILLGTLF